MKEYRFKSSQYDKIDNLNKLMPNGKSFKIDKYTGEAWIKITNQEHTPELVRVVELFCCFSFNEKILTIKDCSSMNTTPAFNDDRTTLF